MVLKKKKYMTNKEFVIFIVSEEFARELFVTVRGTGFEHLSVDILFESIDTCWVYKKYKNDIYSRVDKILKDDYDLSLEEVKKIFSEGKKL